MVTSIKYFCKQLIKQNALEKNKLLQDNIFFTKEETKYFNVKLYELFFSQ